MFKWTVKFNKTLILNFYIYRSESTYVVSVWADVIFQPTDPSRRSFHPQVAAVNSLVNDQSRTLVVNFEAQTCAFESTALSESIGVFVVSTSQGGDGQGDEDAPSVVSVIRTDGPVESPARKKESVDEVRLSDRSSIPVVERTSESSVLPVLNEEVIVWTRAFEGRS